MSATKQPVKMINATAYYLENKLPGHSKFYLIIITDSGVVVTNWGRIGAANGQSKVDALDPTAAETIGMRQFYAKRSGGYEVVHEAVKFQIDEETLSNACTFSNAAYVTRPFWKAVTDPDFDGDKKAVLTHYDELVKKAQRLMDTAGGQNFESVYAQFEEIEAIWTEIQEKHDEVSVTLDFTRQMLNTALLSGKL